MFKYELGEEVYAHQYKSVVKIVKRWDLNGTSPKYQFTVGENGTTGSCYEEDLEREEAFVAGATPDAVKAPSHYANRKYQSILVMEDSMSTEEFKGFLKGNVMKYTTRAGQKDTTVQDLCKAATYLQWLIEVEGKGSLQNVPSYNG